MANEKNLMPIEVVNSRRTREQHSEDSRKGGIESGAARRRKRSMRAAAEYYASLPVTDQEIYNMLAIDGVDPADIDNQMAMVAGLIKATIGGDSKAGRLVLDILGDLNEKGGNEDVEDDPITKSLKEETKNGLL